MDGVLMSEQPKPDVTPAAPGGAIRRPRCKGTCGDATCAIREVAWQAARSAGEEPTSSTPSGDATEQDWQRIAQEQSQRAESLQNTLLEYICRNGEKDEEIARRETIMKAAAEMADHFDEFLDKYAPYCMESVKLNAYRKATEVK